MISAKSLLQRGDRLAIENGLLTITPASGKPVPEKWLEANSPTIIQEIIQAIGLEAFRYENYSTGKYGTKLAAGIQLQFESLLTLEPAYCVFNAELNYSRDKNKGKPLPKGRFRVGKKSAFVKFWQRCTLKLPPRLSSFHDYMGNLKRIVLTATHAKGEKLDKGSLAPLSLTNNQIRAAFFSTQPYNKHTHTIQTTYNSHTNFPHKQSSKGYEPQASQTTTTTGEYNHGLRLNGNTDRGATVIPLSTSHKKPKDQTNDEWLADFGDADSY
ncbi:MAG: hypothetical protein K6L73_02420 [Cellvibrionaceae bacterium]